MSRIDFVQAHCLEEALLRAEMFAEIGADILFIDALESEDEMRQFTSLGGVASGVPKMASLLEGGGKTPMLPLQHLQLLGFKIVAYPLSLLAVSVHAMQSALQVGHSELVRGHHVVFWAFLHTSQMRRYTSRNHLTLVDMHAFQL
jgi:2-methylisocitrate lyase-like PEP mutase family enzyme